MDEKTIERLKAEHGEVHVLTVGDNEIAVRMPTVPEFDRFMAAGADTKKVGPGLKQLVRDCLVHPSVAEFNEMVSRRPGLFLPFGQAVAEIAGATVEAEVKKA